MVEYRDIWWSIGTYGGVEGHMVEYRDIWWSIGTYGGV